MADRHRFMQDRGRSWLLASEWDLCRICRPSSTVRRVVQKNITGVNCELKRAVTCERVDRPVILTCVWHRMRGRRNTRAGRKWPQPQRNFWELLGTRGNTWVKLGLAALPEALASRSGLA